MDGLTCDRCGIALLVHERVRYHLDLKLYAAYDPLEVTATELREDHADEIRRLIEVIEQRDPEELLDEVARAFRVDLCPPCQKLFLSGFLKSFLGGGGAAP